MSELTKNNNTEEQQDCPMPDESSAPPAESREKDALKKAGTEEDPFMNLTVAERIAAFEWVARNHITSKKRQAGLEGLLSWLKNSDFYIAPASTKYHLSVEGGLFVHSMHVFNRMLLNNTLGKPEFDEEDIAIVSLFHDICKVYFYALEEKNQKVYRKDGKKSDSKGAYDWETIPVYVVDDKYPLGHGEKSLDRLKTYFPNTLTKDHCLATRWHMLFADDAAKGGSYALGAAMSMCPLLIALSTADMQASYFDEIAD